MDFNGTGFSSVHIGQGLQDLIVHRNRFGGCPGDGFGFGHHPGQNITDVAGGFAFGNHYRPVLMDDTDHALPGDVSGRKNPHDARHLFGSRAIYAADVRPGMFAEFKCGVQHSIQTQVIDKSAGTDRFVVGVVFRLAGPHPAGSVQFELPPASKVLRRELDSIDNFHITRAAA